MNKKDKAQLIELTHEVSSPQQRDRAMPADEMPACAGTGRGGCGVARQFIQVMFRGYDDKDRCERCNRIHIEEVFKEAGDAPAGASSNFIAAPLATKAENKRREMIIRERMNRQSGEIVDSMGEAYERTQQPAASEADMNPTQRRNAILARYGITK